MAVFTYPNCACCGGSSRSSVPGSSLRPSSPSSALASSARSVSSGALSGASSVATCCDLPNNLCAYVLLSASSASADPQSGIFPLGSSGSSQASSAAGSSSASPVPLKICLRRTGEREWSGSKAFGASTYSVVMSCVGVGYVVSVNGSASSAAIFQDCGLVRFDFSTWIGFIQVLQDDGTCCVDSSSSSGSDLTSVQALPSSGSGQGGLGGSHPCYPCASGISALFLTVSGSNTPGCDPSCLNGTTTIPLTYNGTLWSGVLSTCGVSLTFEYTCAGPGNSPVARLHYDGCGLPLGADIPMTSPSATCTPTFSHTSAGGYILAGPSCCSGISTNYTFTVAE